MVKLKKPSKINGLRFTDSHTRYVYEKKGGYNMTKKLENNVRSIFRDTYNTFLKFKDISETDSPSWDELHVDTRKLVDQYPGGLCESIMLAITKTLLESAREGR